MKEIVASAPGKIILLGEHAVVYGYPAIALAISISSKCEIQEIVNGGIQIVFKNFNQAFDFSNINDLILNLPTNYNQIRFLLINFKERFNIDLNKIKITFTSLLFPNSGLGSSAAIAVALISALNEYYNLNLEKKEISKYAFDMEKIVHGSPSGIDNTICTYGNMIFYQTGNFRFIKIPYELKFLVTYTNIEHNTKMAIDQIRLLQQKDPKKVEETFAKIGEITKEVENELIANKGPNFAYIGKLMNRNQNLLSFLKVSNSNISEITNLALKLGAYGSKLTGAGLGGCVITLGKDEVLSKLLTLLKQKGYTSFIANMDREGVKIERK
jgi:mevalonate kinase